MVARAPERHDSATDSSHRSLPRSVPEDQTDAPIASSNPTKSFLSWHARGIKNLKALLTTQFYRVVQKPVRPEALVEHVRDLLDQAS